MPELCIIYAPIFLFSGPPHIQRIFRLYEYVLCILYLYMCVCLCTFFTPQKSLEGWVVRVAKIR